jgi:hypothetical protein
MWTRPATLPPGVAVAEKRGLQGFVSPHKMRRTEVYLVYEARNAARPASFEDRRMWRLLLARLHPDAGGDHDLFAFACAVRDEMSRVGYPAEDAGAENEARNTADVAPFLETWHKAMDQWSSSNRDVLNKL